MRKHLILVCAVALLAACNSSNRRLRDRAEVLCRYIPDHELQESSREYMTQDFYSVLDTLFHHLPEHEAMDHEWLYYFVTGNGGTIADYEVAGVERIDATHAVATIAVRQVWEDGEEDETSDIEEHQLVMERVDGQWLMADFDGHKADCIRHIDINRQEQAVRRAISDYLVREVGSGYRQGELCIPTLMIVAEDAEYVWGDFWVMWYNQSGDTLLTVSGGNHSGKMTLRKENDELRVAGFEQTEDGAGNDASAKRIFGEHYDIYQNMHSSESVREAVRREQLGEYIKRHGLPIRYYRDYGWPAVSIEEY